MKVTLTVQLEPAVRESPHVVVLTAKSPPSVPAGVMPEMARVPGRLFLIVTILTALVVPTVVTGNFKLEGLTVTGRIPVPVKLTDCGLLLALSVIASVADLAPTASGAKTMLMVQEAFTFSVCPQVAADCWKSLGLVPTTVHEMPVTTTPVLFVSVTFFAVLVLPRA